MRGRSADADGAAGWGDDEPEGTEMSPLIGHGASSRAASSTSPPADGARRHLRVSLGGVALLLVVLGWWDSDAEMHQRGAGRLGEGRQQGASSGGGCSAAATRDCTGRCAPLDWIGDGWCDIGTDGHDLNCSLLNHDGGDCTWQAVRDRTCDGRTEREILDCHGNCALASWLGDHGCDDPDEVDGMVFLNCAALGFDGGDCALQPRGCEVGYVVAPCVVEELGVGLPPVTVCVPGDWVGDGSCDVSIEDGYGLNCSETNWDGGDCLAHAAGECGGRVVGCDGGCIPVGIVCVLKSTNEDSSVENEDSSIEKR